VQHVDASVPKDQVAGAVDAVIDELDGRA
jgi:hypothetical protein